MVRQAARYSARIFILLLALSSVALAYDETRDPWIRGVFTGHSPRPEALPEPAAWQRADEIVRATTDAFALVGGGHSMQPLYPPGTILVLRQVAFHDLRPGQTALYRNQAQRPVAHVLVTKCRDGWRVRGLNNARHDPEAVVAENFIGVVIAAFTPSPSPAPERRVASR